MSHKQYILTTECNRFRKADISITANFRFIRFVLLFYPHYNEDIAKVP